MLVTIAKDKGRGKSATNSVTLLKVVAIIEREWTIELLINGSKDFEESLRQVKQLIVQDELSYSAMGKIILPKNCVISITL